MKALLALLGPLRLPLIALLVGGAVVIGAYQTGVNAERKRGEAASLRQQLETVLADRRIALQAEASARRMAATLEAEARAYQEELDALRKDLAARPEADRRPIPDAAYDRLYGK
jgi:hypothetical protein